MTEPVPKMISESADFADDELINTFGYAEKYRRILRGVGNLAVVIALTSPLSAQLVVSSYPVFWGGYWGLSWGWIIPSFIFFPQALAVAELASSMPVNGAFYWWTAALAPRKWAKPLSLIIGTVNVFSLVATIAGFAYASASMLAISIYVYDLQWMPTNAQLMGISFGIIVLWTALMFLRLEDLQWVLVICSSVILTHMLVYWVALPVSHHRQKMDFATAAQVFGQYDNFSDWEPAVAVPITFFAAAWVNTGWVSPAYLAEGTHRASHSTPKSIIVAYLTTAITGFVTLLISAFCISDIGTLAAIASEYPLIDLIVLHWGSRMCFIFMIAVAVFGLTGGSSAMLICSYQVAAFARDGGLPYSDFFAHVNKRTNIPLHSTGALVVSGMILLILALSEVASGIIYSLSVLAQVLTWILPIALRVFAHSRFKPGPFSLGIFSIPVHIWATCSLAWLGIMEAFPLYKNWNISTFNYNWVITTVVLFLAIARYLFFSSSFKGVNQTALEHWREHGIVVDAEETISAVQTNEQEMPQQKEARV